MWYSLECDEGEVRVAYQAGFEYPPCSSRDQDVLIIVPHLFKRRGRSLLFLSTVSIKHSQLCMYASEPLSMVFRAMYGYALPMGWLFC